MRIISKIARVLFVITLPVLFFSTSIAWAVNSQWIYTSGFERHGAAATTGLDKEQLENVASDFIRYWNSGEERINIVVTKNGQSFPLFNEREIAHLVNVKSLFRFDYSMMFVSGVYALGYALFSLSRRRTDRLRRLAGEVTVGSGLTLVLMLALGLAAFLGTNAFANFWYQFHILSFANDFWQLDPTNDYLLMLVPEGFWYDAVRNVVFVTVGLSIVCGGAAVAHLMYDSRRVAKK